MLLLIKRGWGTTFLVNFIFWMNDFFGLKLREECILHRPVPKIFLSGADSNFSREEMFSSGAETYYFYFFRGLYQSGRRGIAPIFLKMY